MELPPRPKGSQISVISDHAPLTLEWRSQAEPPWRAWVLLPCMFVGAGMPAAILALVGLPLLDSFPKLASLPEGAWACFISLLAPVCLFSLYSTGYPLYTWIIHRFAPDLGRARLVVMPDTLLWMEGEQITSRVIARNDVLECGVDCQFGWCFLHIKGDWIGLFRSYRDGDRDWLGDVLKRWHSGAA